MTDNSIDPAAARITDALSASIRAGEMGDTEVGMVGAWVLVGMFHDGDGDQRSTFLCPDDQRLHETLGLLEAGRAVYGDAMRRWVLGNNREDDDA